MRWQISILFCFLVSFLFSQNEEEDLSFVKRNYGKDRKITFLLGIQTGISVLSGAESQDYRDYLEQQRQILGYDKLKATVQPKFSISLSLIFKISDRILFGAGLKYQYLGWREIVENRPVPDVFQQLKRNIYFHYVGIPVFIKINAVDNMGFRFGLQPTFLVKDQVIDKEKIEIQGQKDQMTRKMSVEDIFLTEPQPVNLLLNMAFDIGVTENTFITVGATAAVLPLFKTQIQLSTISIDVGIMQEF